MEKSAVSVLHKKTEMLTYEMLKCEVEGTGELYVKCTCPQKIMNISCSLS